MEVKLNLDGLRKLKQRAQELDGTHQVPVSQLLNAGFMRKHTSFADFEAMVKASPFPVNTAEEFQAIPDAEWNMFVRQQTKFASWRKMLSAAAAEWMKQRLFT